MRSDFKLQKLFLLLILSLSTLSGCITAPPEPASSPTPETPVVNEQPQASGAENTNPLEPSPNPSPTQEPTELEKKWDEFLKALETNIINESETNFQAVQTKAQELKTLADEQAGLEGLGDYLDALIPYTEGDITLFNNNLVRGLGFQDLALIDTDGDATSLLSDGNKQNTAKQVVDKLNSKYRSLLVSSTPGQPSPAVSISPTASPTISPSPSIADPQSDVKTKWNDFLRALSKNITNVSPDNFQQIRDEANELRNVPGAPEKFLNAVINYQGEHRDENLDYYTFNNDLVRTGLGIKDLAIGDPTLLLSDLNRENTAIRITDILNYKYRSELISYPGKENSDNPLRVIAVCILIAAFIAGIIKLNIFNIKLYIYRKKLNISLDLNNCFRWSSSNNVGTSTTGAYSYQRTSAKTPTQQSLYPERTSVINVTWPDIDSKEQNQQIVSLEQTVQEQNQQIVSLEQTVQEQNQQIVSLEEKIKELTHHPTPSPRPQPQEQNVYKQMISQTIPVEDKNMTARRMGSGAYPFFLSTKSRQAHLGVYQDPSGQDFLLPTKPKTNHEKLKSYFDLQGSSKDGEVEVIKPAIVIPSGQGWELDQKGIVEFR